MQNKDSTLPFAERANRLQVVKEFLKAGIPLRKMDKLRPLLEMQGYRLSHSSNMMNYISVIFKEVVQRIKTKIQIEPPRNGIFTQNLSVIFYGSTRQGEVIVIVVRFVDDDWNIIQRLNRIEICAESVTGSGTQRVFMYGVRCQRTLSDCYHERWSQR